MVGQWAKAENFYEWQQQNLICWGGLTAGDWQYIGSQGVIQGTYEIFMRIAERHFGGDLAGRFILTAGLGGMGGAQPLAGLHGRRRDPVRRDRSRAHRTSAWPTASCDERADDLDDGARDGRAPRVAERRAASIGLVGNAAEVYEQILARGVIPDIVTDQTSAHDLVYGYVPVGRSLADVRRMRRERSSDADGRRAAPASCATCAPCWGSRRAGAVVFDNGNLIRTQAREGGVADAFDIPIFTEAFLRPLFARAIGPFRWIALANDPDDIRKIDDHLLRAFPDNRIVTNWVTLAREHVPFEGLPARIAWLGHGERTALALAVNRMVRDGQALRARSRSRAIISTPAPWRIPTS